MILWDVNLWVYAFRPDSPWHAAARQEIQSGLTGGNEFLFSPLVASSFLRLVTNPRIFKEPSAVDEAWEFADVLESCPRAHFATFDPMAFGIFKHLVLGGNLTGNSIPDAQLAALAIRHDAVLVTKDGDFKKLAGLKIRSLA